MVNYYKKSFVRGSLSSYVSPAFLTSKDNTWRIYVDSCAISRIIVKYSFQFLDLMTYWAMMAGSHIFSNINLRIEYHQIHIRHSNEWKTSLKIKNRLYKQLVIHFGLSNMSSTIIRDVVSFLDMLLLSILMIFSSLIESRKRIFLI